MSSSGTRRRRSNNRTSKEDNSDNEDSKATDEKARKHSNGKEIIVSSKDSEGRIDQKKDTPVGDSAKEQQSFLGKVFTRTLSACVMTGLYLLMLQAGHFYCILVGVISQFEMFRELVNVRYVQAKERQMPLFRTLQWGYFFLSMLYTYGERVHDFCEKHRSLIHFTKVTQYIDYIVFVLYCIIFMFTVLTFKQGLIRFQISQVFWTIVTICIVVFQSSMFATNIMNGLFWFFFPMATVVMNDVSAYFCGITMGKKLIKAPFLALSPNKTWEGFIGAAVLTMIFSFIWPLLLSRWTWFTCPLEEGLFLTPFPPALTCDPLPVFLPAVYTFPAIFGIGGGSITLLPIQLHGLIYGIFASLVAPFGGFFASAIKRAYGKKDFDSFMPGHGGMMDRMDCQMLMIAFTFVHYNTFIRTRVPKIEQILATASLLTLADQKLLQQKISDQINSLQSSLKE